MESTASGWGKSLNCRRGRYDVRSGLGAGAGEDARRREASFAIGEDED
jgi:hypothetical protein